METVTTARDMNDKASEYLTEDRRDADMLRRYFLRAAAERQQNDEIMERVVREQGKTKTTHDTEKGQEVSFDNPATAKEVVVAYVAEIAKWNDCSVAAVHYAAKLVDEHFPGFLSLCRPPAKIEPYWSRRDGIGYRTNAYKKVSYKLHRHDKHLEKLGNIILVVGEHLAIMIKRGGSFDSLVLQEVQQVHIEGLAAGIAAKNRRPGRERTRALSRSRTEVKRRATRKAKSKATGKVKGKRMLGAWLASAEKAEATRKATLKAATEGTYAWRFAKKSHHLAHLTTLKWRRLVDKNGAETIYDRTLHKDK